MSIVASALEEHQQTMQKMKEWVPQIEAAAQQMLKALNAGGKIFWMGNGGSAADSQHLAAELIGRFKKERRAIPSIALTTDSSILTCLSNDYDFSIIFSRQLEALCQPQDVVIGISTSGNSKNVIAGLDTAKRIGAYTIALVGQTGGLMAGLADTTFMVPSQTTARIQEAHIFIGHSLCECVEHAVHASLQQEQEVSI